MDDLEHGPDRLHSGSRRDLPEMNVRDVRRWVGDLVAAFGRWAGIDWTGPLTDGGQADGQNRGPVAQTPRSEPAASGQLDGLAPLRAAHDPTHPTYWDRIDRKQEP